MFWSTRPFVRAFLFLTMGILTGYYLPLSLSLKFYLLLLAILVFFLLLATWGVHRINRFKYQWVQGLIIGLMLAFTGILMVTLRLGSNAQVITEETGNFKASVVNEPMPTLQSVKTILRVYPLPGNESKAYSVRVIAFFEKNEQSEALKYGDLLVFRGRISPPRKPMNPGEFDYKNYLAINGIHYSVFLSSGKWQKVGYHPPNVFRKTAVRFRNYLLKSLQENGLGGRNYAVAAAILLGYDNLMDTALEQDFVTAGAMHILCVSGLHVGIIYLVFNFLFGFFKKSRRQQMLKAFLLLLLVWAYAMLTGLSPSVQRAAVMISIFIIGNALNRQRDAYNTLAASAFLLLLFNPLLIFNVGFQLSYAAVLGILSFHWPIYGFFYFRNPILDKFWSVTALSFAAQLGTFPLAAHYFHFFPTYFWLSNLLIFPLSFLIITAGMAFISVSWLPFIPKLLGIFLSGLIFILNQSVGLIKYLPFHGISDLYFPWGKVLLMYVFIVLLFFLITQKSIRLLLPVLTALLLLLTFETLHRYRVLHQKRIVIYSINKSSAYDFIDGEEHLLLLDSLMLKNDRKLGYFLSNSRLAWGLERNQSSILLPANENNIDLYFDVDFAAFGDFKIAIVDGMSASCRKHQKKIKLDAVFVKGKQSLKLQDLQSCFDVNQIVLDASVPRWKSGKIEKEGESLGMNTYNVKNEGAFIVELSPPGGSVKKINNFLGD
jgi:competence protein ComEC